MRLFRRLQLTLEPTGRGTLLHGIRLFAILAEEPSRAFTAWRQDELEPRAAPWTPAIFDLPHADILADQHQVSILNMVVAGEYSTLEIFGAIVSGTSAT